MANYGGGSSSGVISRMVHDQSQRRPRGRPPGSKNKPKPPVIVDNSVMRTAVLEISADSDIIDVIINFALRSHCGVSVISARGSVSNFTLRYPMSHTPPMTLRGTFNLLSLSGTFLGSALTSQPSSGSGSLSSAASFGISVAGTQGQVYGGIVAGKVMAASTVIVVAATFLNPSFHRFPIEQDDDESMEAKPSNVSGGVNTVVIDANDRHHQTSNVNSSGPSTANNNTNRSVSVYGHGGVSPSTPVISNAQMSPSDIMHWGTPGRPY